MTVSTSIGQAAAALNIEPLSLVVTALDGSLDVRIDADRPLYPASMIKTPLAAVMWVLIKDGLMGADQTVPVTGSNMTANDEASPLVPGYRARIGELIELMIARSDNVATNVLLDVADRERATAIARERLNLPQTAFHRKLSGSLPLIEDPQWDGIHRNAHPAADAARLFESIARSAVPGSAELYGVLARQTWNEKLPRGLDPGDVFAHKTGDTDEVTHDGGILSTQQGGVYVLAVYTGMPSTPGNNAKFGPFMARLRTLLR